ncbi:hypothetical protein Bpfe_015252 [Biomphalaria pfeifferi]|uniref:Uncharacterized protein n=1 Tax=Biomphalaria pfeifferi TaxID=112525 RepID=A0AAD8BJP2_BIOPF|nr:hypothetical protein Bpfe_015252 [Biomphalaria pfeifferi]
MHDVAAITEDDLIVCTQSWTVSFALQDNAKMKMHVNIKSMRRLGGGVNHLEDANVLNHLKYVNIINHLEIVYVINHLKDVNVSNHLKDVNAISHLEDFNAISNINNISYLVVNVVSHPEDTNVFNHLKDVNGIKLHHLKEIHFISHTEEL